MKTELEEAAEKEFPLLDTKWCRTGACEEENLHLLGHRRSFIKGAKWMQERSYSEADMRKAIDFMPYHLEYGNIVARKSDKDIENFIEQFKKK